MDPHATRTRTPSLQSLIATMRDDDLRHSPNDCRVCRADPAVMNDSCQSRKKMSVIHPMHGDTTRQPRSKFFLQPWRKLALAERDDRKRTRQCCCSRRIDKERDIVRKRAAKRDQDQGLILRQLLEPARRITLRGLRYSTHKPGLRKNLSFIAIPFP